MNEVKKNKSDKKANQPVQKSTSKGKDLNPDKNKPPKGKSNGDVPDSPTTEVNPEGLAVGEKCYAALSICNN